VALNKSIKSSAIICVIALLSISLSPPSYSSVHDRMAGLSAAMSAIERHKEAERRKNMIIAVIGIGAIGGIWYWRRRLKTTVLCAHCKTRIDKDAAVCKACGLSQNDDSQID